jgi:hypothetical protein
VPLGIDRNSGCYRARRFVGGNSAADKDDIIATLNDLIETSRDGEEGLSRLRRLGVRQHRIRVCQ